MITQNDTKTAVPKQVQSFVDDYIIGPTNKEDDVRREHPRYPLGEAVEIMLDSSQRPAEIIMATGRDISLSGIGLYSHRPTPKGTDVIVNINNADNRLTTRAITVHSTLSVGLFKVGARFIPSYVTQLAGR